MSKRKDPLPQAAGPLHLRRGKYPTAPQHVYRREIVALEKLSIGGKPRGRRFRKIGPAELNWNQARRNGGVECPGCHASERHGIWRYGPPARPLSDAAGPDKYPSSTQGRRFFLREDTKWLDKGNLLACLPETRPEKLTPLRIDGNYAFAAFLHLVRRTISAAEPGNLRAGGAVPAPCDRNGRSNSGMTSWPKAHSNPGNRVARDTRLLQRRVDQRKRPRSARAGLFRLTQNRIVAEHCHRADGR